MYASFRETCSLPDTKLIIAVDQDDRELPTYWKLLNGVGQVQVTPAGTRRGMCDSFRYAFEALESNIGFAVGFMGDDHRPRTYGWDEQYVSNLRELGTGIVYGDDGFQHENIPTQVAMTTDIPRTLGYFFPHEFQHLCVDVVWKDWGVAIDRLRYLPGVLIEHMHPLAGKAREDGNYAAVNNSAIANHDNQVYRDYHDSGRFDSDISKLRALLS